MKSNKVFLTVSLVITLVIASVILLKVPSFSVLEWLGFGGAANDEVQQAAQPGTSNWAKATEAKATNGNTSEDKKSVKAGIDFNQIKVLMENLNADKRDALLTDEKAFQTFIEQELSNASVLAAARANNLEKDPLTSYLMQKSAENTLREVYINRLIKEKIPDDFPNEEQMQNFYEQNKDRFILNERIHVWQVFLPVQADADAAKESEIKKQLEDIKKTIESGKVSFAEAAAKHSKHQPSNRNGGYMGLIKMTDLKPEVRQIVLELKEGQLSQEVKTDSGYHLIKRGAKLDAQEIPYEQVQTQIRQVLQREAVQQFRKTVYEQAKKTFPVELDEKRIEEWRLRLRTNL